MVKLKYTGERLVSGEKTLLPMRVENLARYHFFASRITGQRVLDLGCGDGEGSGYLRNFRDWSVYSVDIATEAICFAHQKYGENGTGLFLRMDVRNLAFNSSTFDGIISVEVIEHIDDPGTYLSEVKRVLKKDGLFILTTPNRLRTAPRDDKGSIWPAHVKEYTPEELFDLTTNYFSQVELWGEQIPIYEENIFRKTMGKFAPIFKKILPYSVRIRALPTLQYIIKSNIDLEDVEFSRASIEKKPTILAICKK